VKVYIAGKISGNENYQEDFRKAQERFEKGGHIVLNPASLPEGMKPSDYMKICFAMIDVADTVFFINGWENSKGANLELSYCLYCGKDTSESWRKEHYDSNQHSYKRN
jgi:hypothetical protein